MLTKILIFAAVVIGVFVVARMGASSAVRPTLKRRKSTRVEKGAEDLVACPVCGAYVPRGEKCSCGGTPTP